MEYWKVLVSTASLVVILFVLTIFSYMSPSRKIVSWAKYSEKTACSTPLCKSPLFHRRRNMMRNKSFIPDICVAFLSCKRIHHLRKSFPALIQYFEKYEPNITYEIAILDNGSDRATVNEIINDFPIDVTVLRQENVGIAAGLNALFHGACRSPFILSMEDDWEARVDEWYPDVPVMAMSMHILRHDPIVSEIWLRDWPNAPGNRRNLTKWVAAPNEPRILNGREFAYRRMGRTQGSIWGAYTNGASLKDAQKIRKIGYMGTYAANKIIDFDGEGGYSQRVFESGFTSAHLCLPYLHPQMQCHRMNKTSDPVNMRGLFAHLGGAARSPGHSDFTKL